MVARHRLFKRHKAALFGGIAHQRILGILHRRQHRLLIGEIGLLLFFLLGADIGVRLRRR